MKNRVRILIIVMSILFVTSAFAANPFLDAKENIDGEIPLTARVVTTRIATMPWGAIFRIEFVDLKSRAKQKREISRQYFIATENHIFLLNEENNEAAVKKISAMDKPPNFEQGDIRAITSGKLKFEEGPYTTTIEIKGDECSYLSSHNSGHYSKFVWKKSVGLIEHASNYGAMKGRL